MHRTLALAVALLTTSVHAQDWPAWRGPTHDGIAPAQTVPLEWDRKTNIRWRTPLDQPGNGSPIVSGGRVFLTMPEDREGKGRSLLCLDADTGELLWKRTVAFDKAMPTHTTNPHCSTTPVADGERVVVWHASAGLHCYDFDGEPLWDRDLGEFRHQWGHGTSPILHDDLVILHSGPGEESFVAAFHIADGEMAWKNVEPDHRTDEQREQKRLSGSWCTPLIARVGDRDLVICGHPTRVVAYDATSGEIVWTCRGVTAKRGDLTYSSPVVAGDTCIIQGGYVGPTFAVKMDGEGDVTETHRIWHNPEQMSNCGSGIHADGHVYLPDMQSLLCCIDPADGSLAWKKRIGRGGTWGSIIQVGEHLMLMNQTGTVFVFRPNAEELEIVAKNELGEHTNSTPAVANGALFLRTHAAIYCVAAADGDGGDKR